jgi:HAMP domain-containing protein
MKFLNQTIMELQPIQNWIYEIRGYKVMLDFHLAEMYEIETKRLKEAVRRNIERFPDDFMFELTRQEWEILNLRSQIATSSWGGTRYQPFTFTERGVAMLSSVLNSKPAIATNIRIMRAFIAVRQLVLNPPVNEVKELKNEVRELKQYMEDAFTDYNDINENTRLQLELINETLTELQTKHKELNKPCNPIGFNAPQYKQ